MYSITFVHETNLIDIAWNAVMDGATAKNYLIDIRRRFIREGFSSGYRLRLDLQRVPLQSQDAVDVFVDRFARLPRAGRIAVVTSNGLTRLQIRRLLPRSDPHFFDAPEDALGWLLSSGPAVAAVAGEQA